MPARGGEGSKIVWRGDRGEWLFHNGFDPRKPRTGPSRPPPSSHALAPGPNVIRVEFRYDGGGIGKGGTASLFVNGEKVGEGRIEALSWGRFSADETFDVGADTGSPASADYGSPNRFTGTIEKVVIDAPPANLSAEDERTIRLAEQTARLGVE